MNNFTNNNQAGQQPMGQGMGMGQGQEKQDYGDKAFGMLSKKSGHTVDRNTEEKITDGARNLFEKATGKKVSSKISN